ncbi:class I SAM-dependent methyltransferase [Reyranella sp.]|uniref:class I SAM-dependent methyltransferase n=1 Tax=Reyranella sp. TaxID=1929291 RepID=UPI003D0C07E2
MTGFASDLTHVAYESPDIVALYAGPDGLQEPEATLLAQLGSSLGEIEMLDIGVGGGRTTRHFAPLAKTYLGVDYSSAMIERCRLEFPAFRFAVADARRLDFAADESYDLVLFSYNGIDHLDAVERQMALREMHRVLRPGGLMVFSSHNANYLPAIIDRFRFRIKPGLRETLRSFKWSSVFWLKNGLLGYRMPLAAGRVHDGTHSFRSSGIYYVRPDLGVAELRQLGLIDIACAGNESREFVPGDHPGLRQHKDPWIYYVSRKPVHG